MLKRSLSVLSLVLLLSAVPALAQSEASDEISPEIIAALKNEPPLTQADIDTFIKIMPEMSKAAEKDPAQAVKIYEKAGLTENRFGLIFSKVTLGMFVASGIPKETLTSGQDVPEVLVPSDAEIELIKKNLEALEKAFGTDQ